MTQWRHGSPAAKKIIFSDEKVFVIQQSFNPKNDAVYSASFEDIPEHKRTVQRFQNSSSVMVRGAVSHNGKLPLVFIDKGVKINGAYYQSEILQSQLEPNADELYPNATGFFNKILHQRTRRKWTKSGAGPIVLDLSAPTNGLRHHQTSTRSTFAYGEC